MTKDGENGKAALGFDHEALPWMDDVYRFALSLARDEADAADVLQETYLRAYKSWHTFVRGTDCRRWLFAICRNAFLRMRERQRGMLDIEDGEIDALEAARELAAATAEGEDDILSRLDLAPAIREALNELKEPFRSAVILVDLEDHSYDEASQVLGVPVGTVRSRLFRGRRVLQRRLIEYARDAGFVTAQPDKELSR